MPDLIRTVRAKLLEFALGLPEAHEDFPWGERVVKVNKKVFVFLGRDMDPHFGLGVKLPTSGKGALRMPFTEPTGYGLGKSGWVSAKLDDKSQASFEMLRDWVRESYCAVAPKGLADQITGVISAKKAAKKAKAKLAIGARPAKRQSAATATANKRAAKR
ncbi:MAG: MmcQ/YjbR family DNA-binding protein [Polyangiaceae bacterium]